VIAHPQNHSMVMPQSNAGLNYFIDAVPSTKIGKTQISVEITATDTTYGNPLELKAEAQIAILEKIRDLRIETEHANQEVAGMPFCVKLIALKDGTPDPSYQGDKQIQFALETTVSLRHPPTYPSQETINFVHGIGQSKSNFILTDAVERTLIHAEEQGKAQGVSVQITIRPAKLYGFKILFPQKDVYYQLQPVDAFDNLISYHYTLDEDIRPGSILTGSGGSFYEVQDIIGHGAMGKVYKGRRLNDSLEVAIKTTLFSALSDINRFLLEGLMLIRFNHPNIVKGYDLRQLCIQDNSRVQSKLFMVMEYLPGQTAKDLLDASKAGVLGPAFASKIVLYTARALAYMWEHQTIHRDIKPENIQITEKNEIKLIDLGIAHAEGGEVDISVTQKDTIVGSYPYISPERIKSSVVDFRSDIYSLGATFYQLLTGMAPYLDTYKGPGGKDLLDYLVQVRIKRMPTPIQNLVNVSPSLAEVVMTMLNIKVQKRYQSAEDLIRALEKVYAEFA